MQTRKWLIIVLTVTVVVATIATVVYTKWRQSANYATVYKQSGQVFYGKSKDSYQELTSSETQIESGTYVKTGSTDAQAHVVLPDDSLITLDSNTEIQVQFNSDATNIQQVLGNTWHRVQKLVVGKAYSVETPTAIASVRGTKFWVSNDKNPDEAELLVSDGEVNYSQTDTENGKKIIKESIGVRPGKVAKAFKYRVGVRLALTDISEEKKATKFFRRNADLDTEFDKVKDANIIQKHLFRERLKQNIEANRANETSQTTPSRKIINTNEAQDIQTIVKINVDVRFCKDFKNATVEQKHAKVLEIAKKYGVTELTKEQYSLVTNQIADACLKLIAQLNTNLQNELDANTSILNTIDDSTAISDTTTLDNTATKNAQELLSDPDLNPI